MKRVMLSLTVAAAMLLSLAGCSQQRFAQPREEMPGVSAQSETRTGDVVAVGQNCKRMEAYTGNSVCE